MRLGRGLSLIVVVIFSLLGVGCGRAETADNDNSVSTSSTAAPGTSGPTTTVPGIPDPAPQAGNAAATSIHYAGTTARTLDSSPKNAKCTTHSSADDGLYEVEVHDAKASNDPDFPGFRVVISATSGPIPFLPSGRFVSTDSNSPSEVSVEAYTTEESGFGAYGSAANDGSTYEVTVANGSRSGTVKAKAVPLSESSGAAPLTIEGSWTCAFVEQVAVTTDEDSLDAE